MYKSISFNFYTNGFGHDPYFFFPFGKRTTTYELHSTLVFDRVIKTTKIFKLRKRLILVQTPTIASCKRSSIFRQKNTTVRFTLTRCMSEKRMFLIKKKQVTSRPLILFLKKMVCPRFFNNGGGDEQIVNKKLYVIFRVLYARMSASIANNFFLK